MASPDPANPPAPQKQALLYALGVALLAVAGWVDAVGFVHWGGTFSSFMSGNTTHLGVAVTQGQGAAIEKLFGVMAAFVAGVITGESLRALAGRWHRTAVLAWEALVLAVATALAFRSDGTVILLLLSFAMGTQNAVIHRAEGIGIALTYVTGTLVHLGRVLASTLAGGGDWNEVFKYAGLWLALAAGAFAGGFTAGKSAPLAIAVACGLLLVFLIISIMLGPSAGPGRGASD
ncbi:DUF1275 family protein [Dyella jejuensis]|uniref:DUF1275 family protein n=1 Tax=Dyella jejuensis TaxID=1432009 RepID=A0ABW8JFR7_9GAMM